MIEAEVHTALRAFLRESGDRWPHHLTMARLVARALRLGRDALIQTGVFPASEERYALSYLMPMLLWPGGAIAIASESVRKRLLSVEIPQLQQWLDSPTGLDLPKTLDSPKTVVEGDRWPGEDFHGLLLTSPQAWLESKTTDSGRFPPGIPTLLDGADDWEQWTRQFLTARLEPGDWGALMEARPQYAEKIRDIRVRLTKSVFDRPANPYGGGLLHTEERGWLRQLTAEPDAIPKPWRQFGQRLRSRHSFVWADIDRQEGQFSLYCSPAEVSGALRPLWTQQPTVFVGGALGVDRDAFSFRQRLGIEDLTCVKFSPDRQHSFVHLYAPEGLPLPNTPQFRDALLEELHTLIRISSSHTSSESEEEDLIVIVVGDVPLRAIVGATLAAEFGSRVRVDNPVRVSRGILVTGWEFWREHQSEFPPPKLFAIATLPFPSLEDPLVAGRVAYYKQLRKDWFRLYLLPTALGELQRSIASVRNDRGVVALLDVRAIYRSYGKQIFSALSPCARISSPEAGLFEP
ncbi:helicase C-terminal domain-containing protein [Baaleninema sp.]|uniref:helicase C-terminal domain-containing protein n=1 Tax=Baaleninema sp. TaxID=3101197 RepID=UPI003D035529